MTFRRWGIGFALLLLLAACGTEPPPPDRRTPDLSATATPCSGYLPPTEPVPASFEELAGRLSCESDFSPDGNPFRADQVLADLDLLMLKYAAQWRLYLMRSGYPALKGVPKEPAATMRLDPGIDSLPVLCQGFQSRQLPKRPIYCRVTRPPSPANAVSSGFVVLPVGYETQIAQYVAKQGGRQSLVSLGLQFAVLFSSHLRVEMHEAGITMPTGDSTMVDICLAGVSLRAILPLTAMPSTAELQKAQAFALPYLSDSADQVVASAARGLAGGQFGSCF